MEVICLEEKAFYALVEQVVERLKTTHDQQEDKWLSDDQAMHLLNVKSKTTLQKLRDEGKVRFSQPQKKIILYDRDFQSTNTSKNTHAIPSSHGRKAIRRRIPEGLQ